MCVRGAVWLQVLHKACNALMGLLRHVGVVCVAGRRTASSESVAVAESE